MTTIATDGKTMAGDSRVGADCRHGTIAKVFRAADGAVLGACGEAFDYDGFLRWYEAGMEGDLEVGDEFEALILKHDGSVICVNEKGHSFGHSVPAAIGSGCRFAYGAMDAGATAEEAVEIAIGRDGFSGAPVTVLKPCPKAKLEAA